MACFVFERVCQAETTLNSTFSLGQIVCEEVFKEMEPLEGDKTSANRFLSMYGIGDGASLRMPLFLSNYIVNWEWTPPSLRMEFKLGQQHYHMGFVRVIYFIFSLSIAN